MNRQSRFALIFATVALTIPTAVGAASPDAKLWNGTWTLNAAKSHFASSAKEASETRTYDVADGKLSMKSSSKDLAGKELSFSYSAAWDGKSYPMMGNPNADSISLKAVSGREVSATSRMKGKVTVQSTAMVSADGKHLTLKRHMLRLKGSPTDVLEFDR